MSKVPPPTLSSQSPKVRSHGLDNLRNFLTALVIYHHTSVPYGGLGSWGYASSTFLPGSSPTLVAFNAVNQPFFLGSFFYLSGSMSRVSLERKGPRTFLEKKVMKLGIPALGYTLLVPPIQKSVVELCTKGQLSGGMQEIERLFISHLTTLRGMRALVWFCTLLLLFDISLVLSRKFALPFSPKQLSLKMVMILNIATSFLLRGKLFTPLNLQLGYLPQYITAYILGIYGNLPHLSKCDRTWLAVVSMVSTASIISLLYLSPTPYKPTDLISGVNWLSLCYTVWNETTGCLLGSALFSLFGSNEWLKRQWGGVARYSYAAFLVHPVVCVGLQSFFDGWKAEGVVKSLVAGSITTVGSWEMGWLLARIPGLRIVLFWVGNENAVNRVCCQAEPPISLKTYSGHTPIARVIVQWSSHRCKLLQEAEFSLPNAGVVDLCVRYQNADIQQPPIFSFGL